LGSSLEVGDPARLNPWLADEEIETHPQQIAIVLQQAEGGRPVARGAL